MDSILNLPSKQGFLLGAKMAELAEASGSDHLKERCDECAFRKGTFPNGCLETLRKAEEAIKDRNPEDPFYCHKGLGLPAMCGIGDEKPKKICSGYLAALETKNQEKTS